MDVAKASTADTLAYFTAKDVTVLQQAVRAAHGGADFARTSSRLWSPFAVHAAEVGYIYDGVEFWPSTPRRRRRGGTVSMSATASVIG